MNKKLLLVFIMAMVMLGASPIDARKGVVVSPTDFLAIKGGKIRVVNNSGFGIPALSLANIGTPGGTAIFRWPEPIGANNSVSIFYLAKSTIPSMAVLSFCGWSVNAETEELSTLCDANTRIVVEVPIVAGDSYLHKYILPISLGSPPWGGLWFGLQVSRLSNDAKDVYTGRVNVVGVEFYWDIP